jgi:hypothetical protein
VVVAGAGAAVLVALIPVSSPGRSAEERRADRPKVQVRTTGHQSELRKTIPITSGAGAAKRVVVSMEPHEVPRIRRGDRIKVTAEVQVTNDCILPTARCAGSPYHYDPVVGSRLVLAKRRRATGGHAAAPISARQRTRCRQRLPNRTHHCVIVFTGAAFRHALGARLGCAPSSCHVNLVLDAHNRRAGGNDKLVIGGNHPDGTILQDKARINAIRFRPGSQPGIRPRVSRRRVTKRLPLTERPHVVYSKRLGGLRDGVQIAVKAKMRTKIGHLPYNVRVNSRLLLTDGRRRTERDELVRRVASLKGEISEGNGFNCTQAEAPCLTKKVGVLRIKRDVGRRGPLYVNLIVINQAKRAAAAGGRAKVGRGGALKVVRYPASMR